MNLRGFSILAAVTAVVVAAAIVAIAREPHGPAKLGEGETAFPKLQGRVNDVAEITVVNRDQKVVVKRTDKGWVLPDKFDYPAQVDKVRELINGLEDFKLIESKTTRAERFARLEVDDPTGKEASAVRVTLKAANGDTLADTIIGKRKYDLSTTGIGGTYIRSPNDNQTWLGRGELDPGRNDRLWLLRKIADVKKERIRSYALTHGDGEKVAAARATPKDENFKPETLAAGQQLKSKGVADNVATTLSFLEFDDVKPAASVKLPEKAEVRAAFATFDGLIVEIDIFEVENDKWARLVAKAGEAVPVAEEPKKETPAAGRKPEKIVPVPDEIKAINAAAGAWVYKLPDYAYKNLTTRNVAFLPDKSS